MKLWIVSFLDKWAEPIGKVPLFDQKSGTLLIEKRYFTSRKVPLFLITAVTVWLLSYSVVYVLYCEISLHVEPFSPARLGWILAAGERATVSLIELCTLTNINLVVV